MRVLDIEGQPLNSGVAQSSSVPEYSFKKNPSGFGQQAEQWRPSKRAIILSVVGLVVVAALVFGLVFGISSDSKSSSSATTANLTAGCKQVEEGNLREYFAPDLYKVTIGLEPEHFAADINGTGTAPPAFAGTAAITFNVTQSTTCLVLHAGNLTFSGITIKENGKDAATVCTNVETCDEIISSFTPAVISSSAQQDLIAIDLSTADVTLDDDSIAIISFNYTGLVGANPSTKGLHRSAPFTTCDPNVAGDNNCEAKVLLATQLERTGARNLFPSYDIPSAKAEFDITVIAPVDEAPVILSNMEEASRVESADGKYVTIEFDRTPVMSTYLIAITAGDLKQVKSQAPDGSGYTVRGWAVPGKEGFMEEAVRVGYKALDYYTARYYVQQPVRKYDLVALPGKTYAMENWGLVIFDEERIYYNATGSGTFGRLRTNSVVCHELAHQWFGNLVTAYDWTQLVVNEGLASEEEYSCMQAASPDLAGDILRYNVVPPARELLAAHEGPLARALAIGSDPLLSPAIPASDLELDDYGVGRIIYAKGATAFFMVRYALDQLMGPLGDFWLPALNNLLEKHQYSTMQVGDVFFAGQEVLSPVYIDEVGPGKEFYYLYWAQGFLRRTLQMAPARGNRTLEREFSINGTAPIGAWFYSTTYPFFDTTIPNMIAPENNTQTIINIATNQSRYCGWNMTQEEGRAAGVPQAQMDEITVACTSTSFFISVITLQNVTDCPANKTSDIPTTMGNMDDGPVTRDAWVLNQHAIKLWRTFYSEQHFNNIINEAKQMQPCPASADTTNVTYGSDNLCCSAAGDLLELSGVLADTLEFAHTGKYPADLVLKAVEALGVAPVTATGLGQYLSLLPAVEALEALRGYVADNPTCAAQLDDFHESLLSPYAENILASAQRGTTAADQDGKQEAVLAKLVASPILMHSAMPDGEMSESVDAVGRRRRRSLLQAANATAPAPAVATAVTPAAAPAPVTAAPAPAENATATPAAATPAAAPAAGPPTSGPTPGAPATESLSVTMQTKLCTLLPFTPLWSNYISGNVSRGGLSSVPADLLPAVYGVAAAMPAGCRSVVEGAYATSQLAATGINDTADGVRYALMRCWLYDATYLEAHRCLHALPNAQDPSRFFNLQPTTLRIESLVIFNNRLKLLEDLKRPWLISNIAKQSPGAWSMVAEDLVSGSLWDDLGTDKACQVMNEMGTPMNSAQFEDMQALLDGKAAACSADMRSRAIGKMLQAKRVAPMAAQQICGFLSSRQV